jgi:spermidine/putrescine-binding protein
LALGYDPYALTEAQLEEVKQKLIALKPNLLGYWTDYTEINQQVAAGDVWLAANTWPDAYKAVRDEGVQVDYVTPKEGRVGWVYAYCIVKNGKNHDLALEFIDALISKQGMVNMATMYGYGAANAEANAEVVSTLDAEMVRVLGIDNPDVVGSTVFLKSLTEKQRADWTRVWDDVKAAP